MKIRMIKRTLAAAIGAAALAFGVQVQVQAQDAGGPGAGGPGAVGQGPNAKAAVHRGAAGKGAGAMQQRGKQGRGMMMARRHGGGPALARLDTNEDGSIDLDEFLARHEDRPEPTLQRLDTNGDGLSREELQAGARPQRPNIDREAVRDCVQEAHPEFAGPAGIEQRFDTLDTDNNSLLSAQELADGRLAHAEEQFSRLDADADGLLTQDELRAAHTDRRELGRATRDCMRGAAATNSPE